jgi:hypothetical protein
MQSDTERIEAPTGISSTGKPMAKPSSWSSRKLKLVQAWPRACNVITGWPGTIASPGSATSRATAPSCGAGTLNLATQRNDRCSGGSLPYLGVSDRQLFPDRSQMWGLKSRFRIRKFGARIGYIGGRLVQSV